MTWFRAFSGISTDTRFLRVAASASTTPGVVLAVWVALQDHACQAEPRGSVSTFHPADYAAFSGLDEAVIVRVVGALRDRGMVTDESRIEDWERKQPLDKTASLRKARQRARNRKTEKPPASSSAPAEGVNNSESHGMSRRDSHDESRRDHRDRGDSHGGHALDREKERSSFDLSEASRQGTRALQEPPLRSTRAGASVGDLVNFLATLDVQVSWLRMTWCRSVLLRWVEQGVTEEQLGAAVARAQDARNRAGDPTPINVKFLDCFVRDVLAGRPPRASTQTDRSQGYAATDRNLAQYLERAGEG